MNRILGISALALVMGTAMAVAQSVQAPRGNSGAVRADERAGTVVSPRDDPQSTNRDQNEGIHEDRLPGGGTTGPLAPDPNGG
jgi:hypothetical protein